MLTVVWMGLSACSDAPTGENDTCPGSDLCKRLTDGGGICLDWSSDGDMILIKRGEELLYLSPETKEAKTIIKGDSQFAFIRHAKLAGNGSSSSVIFVAIDTTLKAQNTWGIYRFDSDGSVERIIGAESSYGIYGFAASRTGRLILYLQDTPFQPPYPNIKVWRDGVIETIGQIYAVFKVYRVVAPSIEPDGTSLTYTGQGEDHEFYSLCQMNLESEQVNLISKFERHIGMAVRSPQRGQYAITVEEQFEGKYVCNLYLLRSEHPEVLEPLLVPNNGYILNPVWSPDGDRVAFDWDCSGVPEVYVMDLPEEFKD